MTTHRNNNGRPLLPRGITAEAAVSVNNSTAFREDHVKENSALLNRHGIYVLFLSIVTYIVLSILISFYGGCNAPEYSAFVNTCYFGAGCTFVVNTVLMGRKALEHHFYRGENGEFRGITYIASATISLIAGTGSFLTSNGVGVCVDVLGVSSPAAQWSEWLVCVPLMTYMIVAIEYKSGLTVADYAIILLMCFSVLVGFLMNFAASFAAGVFLYMFGCFCIIGVLWFVVKGRGVAPTNDVLPNLQLSSQKYHHIAAANRQKALIVLVAILFPLFPVIYLLAWLHVFDRDQVAIAYVFVSVVAKLLFVSSLIDTQVHMSDSLEADRKTEKLVQDSRRNFLRYVFHELRIPLNTLTIGIGFIQEDKDHLKSACREVLRMMNGAACFMSDTLNDVLSHEEGAMNITKTAFVFEDLFRASVKSVNTMLEEKRISILFESSVERTDSSVPHEDEGEIVMMGDHLRLENVLTQFLTQAAKSAPEHSQIKVQLTMKIGPMTGAPAAPASASNPFLPHLLSALPSTNNMNAAVLAAETAAAAAVSAAIAAETAAAAIAGGGGSSAAIAGGGGAAIAGGGGVESNEERNSRRRMSAESSKLKRHSLPAVASAKLLPSADPAGGDVSVHNWLDLECGDLNPKGGSIDIVQADGDSKASEERGKNVLHLKQPSNSLFHRFIASPLLSSAAARDHNHNEKSLSKGFVQICDTTLTITDFGSGMSPQELERLLDPYTCIRPEQHEETDEGGRSTGLWLAIVQRIVESHQGSLIVNTNAGVGTTFGFQIPFNMAPSAIEKQLRRTRNNIFIQGGKTGGGAASNGTLAALQKNRGGRKAITGLSSPSYQSSNVLMSFEPQASTNNLAKLDPPGAVVEQQLGLSLESAKSRPGGASTDRPRGGAVETTRRKQSSSFQAGGGQSSRSRQITTVIAPSGSTMKMAPSWSSRGINADEKNSDPTQVWTYHFLIVDDTPSNRRMLQMVLNKRNIHCDVAQDGKEAVDMVTEHGNRYDFIFMDFTMPIMNGVQATAAIRKLGFDRLIFGLSGNALDDDRKTFLAAGADCVIPKPFRMPQLDALMNYIKENGFKSDPSITFVMEMVTTDAPCELRAVEKVFN